MAEPARDRALLFDLFGTLVRFDAERIPLLELPTGPVRSTIPAYTALIEEIAPGIAIWAFHDTLVAVSIEMARTRRESLREMSSQQRFGQTLRRLGIGGPDLEAHAARLAAAHMEQLAAATVAPAKHRTLLERLSQRLPLGCVSNFDHAATAHRILDAMDLAPLLDVIVVSESFGWCKPAPEIFHEALRSLGVAAAEATFVGDSFDDDVCGATAVGLRAIWLNQKDAPPGVGTAPAAIIRDLADVEGLVRW